MVYLPTWMVDFYGKFVGKYTSPMDSMDEWNSLRQISSSRPHELTSPGPPFQVAFWFREMGAPEFSGKSERLVKYYSIWHEWNYLHKVGFYLL